MNITRLTASCLFILLSFSLTAQEYFPNNIKSHSVQDQWLLKAIRQLISEESTIDQDFQKGRGYILVKKKNNETDSTWYNYELSVQYAAIDSENDVLFPEYYSFVDKRIVMFFLDDTAHFKYAEGSKNAFLKKLEPFLAPKETVTKRVNGKKVRDKNFRPENKYKMDPQKITLQYRRNQKPVILSEYGIGKR